MGIKSVRLEHNPMSEMAAVKPVSQEDMEQGKGGFHRSGTFGSAGMRITIKNLSYSVADSNNKGKQLYLLSGVNGFFEPGQMAALVSGTQCAVNCRSLTYRYARPARSSTGGSRRR